MPYTINSEIDIHVYWIVGDGIFSTRLNLILSKLFIYELLGQKSRQLQQYSKQITTLFNKPPYKSRQLVWTLAGLGKILFSPVSVVVYHNLIN